MCSWRIKWIATISSGTQRSGNAFCTQWKVCPRLFGIASNLLVQTRLRSSAPEYTWAPRKNKTSNHNPGKAPFPKPPGLETTAKRTACKLQQAKGPQRSSHHPYRPTSATSASVGIGIDLILSWLFGFFDFWWVFFCRTTSDLSRTQRKANPVKEGKILGKPVSTNFHRLRQLPNCLLPKLPSKQALKGFANAQ